MKKIVLAGGCFWGVEEFLSRLNGVISTEVGYANGRTENPTYEDVCYKNTYFAEVCLVVYDEHILSLENILKEYWSIVDPTSLNRQGPDVGSQYRTGIYYLDESDLNIILKSKEENQKNYSEKIVTEVVPLINYYKAEEYHQKYLKKNPNGYCHIKL
ncbi:MULTISPECIES: peptide-methionine (S)-S-oxide reductase MsrA [unclassified Clostridium]|uniref:peptide-methionine (S)-S-oxide reductase MsrA n=1 Tax=unclassified Clostridium TaxID=2614128 RepID=UPI0025C3589E|nr:peptide-methionine (S)-S-oxide reductase MsrA [Clostridium sp.]MCI6692351.1 peptide-methionine (S)-S-oxide reductase MsrA [Clostridium sp.]MDY2630974.1 peptide-methionine (S)-S-oxide reductase MsrA [Clostridium sp.]MDY4254011.1 peptide-methionine (S)-S-oxide reductase MsrA [Clostridium sp.]MDY6226945.1 peptide-methionine (S)-S-oxide reductase MsrA [Clostridium sp.]